MVYILIFFTGLIVGSFLNVCIYRIPLKITLLKQSFCPGCKKSVPIWSNIPLLGFILLKGKCHYCRQKISIQYPLIEIVTAIITLLTFLFVGFNTSFFIYSIFFYFLIIISFIDAQTMLIPNILLISMQIFVLVVQIIFPHINGQNALAGMLVGGGSLYVVRIAGQFIYKKESMGFGDIKFTAVAGFFLGWENILLAVYLGFLSAVAVALLSKMIINKKLTGKIALAPYLSSGIIITIFSGKFLIEWISYYLLI
jgi:leader peptidase (prepilin peptidase)/N-methyltransferase